MIIRTALFRPVLAALAIAGLAADRLEAQPVALRAEAASVRVGDMVFGAVQGEWADGMVTVRAAQLTMGEDAGIAASAIELRCQFPADDATLLCPGAPWSLTLETAGETEAGWTSTLNGTFQGLAQPLDFIRLEFSVEAGDWQGRVMYQDDRVELGWQDQPVGRFGFVPGLKSVSDWIRAGSSSGELTANVGGAGEASLSYRVEISGLSLDSPDGRYATEKLGLELSGQTRVAEGWPTEAGGKVLSGQALIGEFYSDFDQHGLEYRIVSRFDGDRLEVERINVAGGDALEVEAAVNFSVAQPAETLSFTIARLDLQFPAAYGRYLEPMGAAYALDGLTVTGSLSWQGEQAQGVLKSGRLEVRDLSVVDTARDRFAITGLEARVESGGSDVDSKLSWRGLLLGRINLGAGEADLRAAPGSVSLAEPLRLQVLGGELAIEELQVLLPQAIGAEQAAAEPNLSVRVTLSDMDMARLTEALDWPRFEGRISGTIPGVTLDQGELAFDGQIRFQMFDGVLTLTGLRIERPFGVLPSLAADLDILNLDLQALTSAFSFGNIAGRLSGYVHDLRLLDWEPVAFDAWLTTLSEGAGEREISRQAVHNLTSLGGGGATTALAGPVLSLFNNFSYEAIGIGCRLHNNVCTVRGLDSDGSGVLIMEGRGLPKIMIRAYNRQMDWPQLVANLQAASSGEDIRIGR